MPSINVQANVVIIFLVFVLLVASHRTRNDGAGTRSLASSSLLFARCPPDKILYPCRCHHNEKIECAESMRYHLSRVFTSLVASMANVYPRPLYREFYLTNVRLAELDNKFLATVRFERILLVDMTSLVRIKSAAFEGTEEDVLYFAIKGENRLDKTYVNQLFDALSSLRNAREMHLELNQLAAIPNYAFRNTTRQAIRLERLTIISRSLLSIASYAFYELAHLRHLTISSGDGLQHLSAHAFDISQPSSRHELTIDLRGNQLTEAAFEPDAFARVQRPVRLQLGNNNLTYLRAEYLKAFLDASQENDVYLQYNELECDCEAYWLLRDRAIYINQVHNAICSGYINIWMLDENEFRECDSKVGYSPRFIFRNAGEAVLSIADSYHRLLVGLPWLLWLILA